MISNTDNPMMQKCKTCGHPKYDHWMGDFQPSTCSFHEGGCPSNCREFVPACSVCDGTAIWTESPCPGCGQHKYVPNNGNGVVVSDRVNLTTAPASGCTCKPRTDGQPLESDDACDWCNGARPVSGLSLVTLTKLEHMAPAHPLVREILDAYYKAKADLSVLMPVVHAAAEWYRDANEYLADATLKEGTVGDYPDEYQSNIDLAKAVRDLLC